MNTIMLGTYLHYKTQNRYEVTGFATHTENLEEMVIYKALYGDKKVWCRPLSMFVSDVEVDGKTVKRFEYEG